MTDEDLEFEQALQEVERSLNSMKERYAQVQHDEQQQKDLQQRFDQVRQELRHTPRSQPLQAELKRIKARLEELEVALESRLFSWSSLREAFWQAIRFGGLGIVVGWLLKSCAG